MAIELTPAKKALANTIFISGAFKVAEEGRGFKGKLHESKPDAPLFPYYISIREKDIVKGWFQPLCNSVVWAISEDVATLGIKADHVLGIPNAGDPIAEAFARINKIHLLKMTKIITSDRREIDREISGNFNSGDTALGVDDLISEAHTKLEFNKGLKANNLILAHLGLAVDREQGGIRKLRAAGVSVSAALTTSQLLDYYLETKRINETTNSRIRNYIDSQYSNQRLT